MAEKDGKDSKKKKRRDIGKSGRRKLIPAFIMLLAGAIAGILMAVGGYEPHVLLFRLFLVLLGFYMLGCILKYTLDRFDRQNTPETPE